MSVETPPFAGDGWVGLQVTNSAGQDNILEGHQYWEDGTGLFGSVGAVEWYTMVGGYWSSTPSDFGVATVIFTSPMSYSYADLVYGDTMDNCELNYTNSNTFSALLPDTPSLSLAKPTAGSLSLTQDVTYPYIYSEDLLSGDFTASSAYDLNAITSDPNFPSFSQSGFVETPGPFKVSSRPFRVHPHPYFWTLAVGMGVAATICSLFLWI